MALVNYVKFQRGTLKTYQSLLTRALVDDNTLYFVQDEDNNGYLYLGQILIGGAGSKCEITSLRDLEDVVSSVEPAAGDFLVCNSNGEWVPSSQAEIIDLIAEQMQFSFEVSEKDLGLTTVNGNHLQKLGLIGFETAATGSYALKGVNGKLQWDSSIGSDVQILKTKVKSIETELGTVEDQIAEAIANAGHLTYEKIDDLSQATKGNVIYLYKKDKASPTDSYDEYMFVSGKLERLGDFGVDLSSYATLNDLAATKNALKVEMDDYVLKTTFTKTVGKLSDLTTYVPGEETNLVNEINSINERLMWQAITN